MKLFNSWRLKRILKKNFSKVQISGKFYIEFINKIFFKGSAYIGPDAYWSGKGGIRIGNNVIFGPKTTIWTYNHNYKSEDFIPYNNDDILKEVVIEDNVWVGMGAMIMPGVIIKEGAVIAAGSVVTRNVEKCEIVGGNPAVVIGLRDCKVYEKLKSESKFYLEKRVY